MINQNQEIENRLQILENEKIQIVENNKDKQVEDGESSYSFIKTITRLKTQKWYIKAKLFIKHDFSKEFFALVDSGVDVNCVQQGLIPIVYFEKTI